MDHTMTPSAMRDALLTEHRAIRAHMDAVRVEATRSGDGGMSSAARAALTGLAEVVEAHLAREESLLRHVLPGADAWGPARVEAMMREHAAEHAALTQALRAVSQGGETLTSTRVLGLLDALARQMADEERDFLGEEVLHDDFMPRDTITG